MDDSPRTYHGIPDDQPDGGLRIDVETTAFSVAEHRRTLYRLHRSHSNHDQFNWGYGGQSPARTAEAILTDALGFTATTAMENAFTDEVVSQLPREWWLTRTAVCHWAIGWQHTHS